MISEHERLQMCLKELARPKTESERKGEAVRAIPFGFPEKKTPLKPGDRIEAYGKVWVITEQEKPK